MRSAKALFERLGVRRRSARAALVGVVALGLVGCVERRMTIRSVPSNALVLLDGQEVGHTPVSVPFTYYGDRQIRLVKDGFETKTVNQRISAPYYEWPGLDFVSEVLLPLNIRDEREYIYDLSPAVMVPSDELLRRAADVRQQGANTPADAVR